MNQQWHRVTRQQRSDFFGNDSAGSMWQFQTIIHFDFCEQQQDVLSADFEGGRPVWIVVGN